MSGIPADDDGTEDAGDGRLRTRKAPNAFRTISEVADDLHIPQHVLRFWETKFPLVKPLKRGGGRRYYRPDDIALLRRISGLLYVQGYTIKGVQRLLRESGGQLSDDIPPPNLEEKASPDMEIAEQDRGHQVGFDLIPAGQPVVIQINDPLAEPSDAQAFPVTSRSTPFGDQNSVHEEVARLRGVLRDMLREMEELRAILN